MVLIISEQSDVSTDCVIEWLRFYNVQFIRLNEGEAENVVATVEMNNDTILIHFKIKGKTFSTDDIGSVWFRRGFLTFNTSFLAISTKNSAINNQVETIINRESSTLLAFIIAQLKLKKSINNPFAYNLNKLNVLAYAAHVGLKIPKTIIINNKEDLKTLLKEPYNQIINKPIQDIFTLNAFGYFQSQGTMKLSDYALVPNKFYYSLFQQYIDKKYELRIFFLNNKFYCSAVFTNLVDGRNLRLDNKMVRIVPFVLPNKIKDKLKKINKKIGIESGSIDMIVDKQDEFYFMEINPVGQFGTMGRICNYNLYEKIAGALK
jgi:ATP-GRASP peptide maturase of grasp-with-spasm system